MNIENATYNKQGDHITRKILVTYTLENNWRVKIYTRHDKARKAYLTSVSECQVQHRDGYSMEFHAVFTDFSKIVAAVPVARYSWHTLEAAHNLAFESSHDLIRQLIESNLTREAVSA
jgi:hypothetical protein